MKLMYNRLKFRLFFRVFFHIFYFFMSGTAIAIFMLANIR